MQANPAATGPNVRVFGWWLFCNFPAFKALVPKCQHWSRRHLITHLFTFWFRLTASKKKFCLPFCFANFYLWHFIHLRNWFFTKPYLSQPSFFKYLMLRFLSGSHEEISARISAPKAFKWDILCPRKSHLSCLCSAGTQQIIISHLSTSVNHRKTFQKPPKLPCC